MNQGWEGVVCRVSGRTFEATLKLPGDPMQEALFRKSNVLEEHLHLVIPGARFRWVPGQKVRFFRLPAWSDRDVEAVEAEAAELELLFGSQRRLKS